jgi:hypothetical protein
MKHAIVLGAVAALAGRNTEVDFAASVESATRVAAEDRGIWHGRKGV